MQRKHFQKNQSNLEREFRLHQIDLALERIEKIYRQTIKGPFKEPVHVSGDTNKRVNSIADAILHAGDNTSASEKNIKKLSNTYNLKNNIEEIYRQLSELVSTLEKLIMEAKNNRKIDPIDSFWEEELRIIKKDLRSIGLDIK
jgi:septation ring formation regulator EzrA